ncbi:mercury transporter MerT [bacterium]|nr:mercury transporter MerT [bacterium]
MTSTNDVTSVQDTNSEANEQTSAPKVLGGLAAFAGIGAILASSCCVIPLVLAAVGASAGIFGAFQTLAEWRMPLLSVAVLSIIGGWFTWWKKRNVICSSVVSCSTSTRSNTSVTLLSISSLIIVLGLSWEYIEPLLLKIIKGHI